MSNKEKYNNMWQACIDGKKSYNINKRRASYRIVLDYIESGSKTFDFACGLGEISLMLEAKGCDVWGCDISDVAIDNIKKYVSKPEQFRTCSQVFGGIYDYIIISHYLEHIKNPVEFLNNILDVCGEAIIVLPNNCRQVGDHVNMQWSSWDGFNKLFEDYEYKKIDEYDNSDNAFQAKIFVFKGRNK